MIFKRILDLSQLLDKKSFFLFGPRGTGKSFLIRKQLTDKAVVFNLLDNALYLRFSAHPEEFGNMLQAYSEGQWIVIDEVQKLPLLLNDAHRFIEEKKFRFLLTGSSARRLRQTHVNLLAGRAWQAELFPLISREIPAFNLSYYLRYGGLPSVYQSPEPKEELLAYVNTYLKEEIQAEAFVRKLSAFTRFLQIAALTSGTTINFASIANDTAIPVSTVREYYQILEDTFLGFVLSPWKKSVKRKPVSTAKFYLFDIGVKNTLAQIENIDPLSDLFGQAFEHFIALELRAYLSYKRLHLPLTYWRSQQGHEVDFLMGDDVAIEVKSGQQITKKHLKGLRHLAEENICKKYYVVSQDRLYREVDGIVLQHWSDFLDDLWAGRVLEK